MHEGLLLLCCALIAWSDLVSRRVSNTLLVVMTAVQCALYAVGTSPITPVGGLTGLFIGFLVLLPFYVCRLMGAGDVKFAALIGFMCGWKLLCFAWVLASFLAGVHASIVILARSRVDLRMVGDYIQGFAIMRWCQTRRGSRAGIPYAAYLAVGASVGLFVIV